MNVKKRLTERFLQSVKPPPATQTYADEYVDEVMRGLRMAVHPSGKRVWIVRHKLGGKKFTVGDYPAHSLEQARMEAGEALQLVAKGIDPTEARATKRRAQQRDTVEACFAEYMEACEAKALRPKALYEKRRIITNEILPRWGKRPVQSITRRDARELLTLVVRRSKSAANCLRVHGGAFFNWLVAGDVIANSPFFGLGKPAATSPRERVLSEIELRLVWRAAEYLGGPFAGIIGLLILTGQRREEIVQLQWPELDLDKGWWTLPGERAKNHRSHTIPLAPEVRAILEALPAAGQYLFSVNRGRSPVRGFSRFKAKLDEKIAELNEGEAIAPWVVHDIRRSVVTHLAESGVAPHIVEAIVNHISGHKGGIAGVYNKATYDEPKRQVLATWASRVTAAAVAGKPGVTNVVTLHPAV